MESVIEEIDYPRTELDGNYIWKCVECTFETMIMYLADTHQCETDHMFHQRVSIEELLETIVKEKCKP